MKTLKTIVATAVIVFAMTSVAMAGVQQLTKDARAVEKTPARYTVTLTDKQLAKLIDDQAGSHVREAQRTKTHARRVHHKHAAAQQGVHEAEAQHVDRVRSSAQSSTRVQSGSHHYENSQQTHVATGGHDSGHAGGHGGD